MKFDLLIWKKIVLRAWNKLRLNKDEKKRTKGRFGSEGKKPDYNRGQSTLEKQTICQTSKRC